MIEKDYSFIRELNELDRIEQKKVYKVRRMERKFKREADYFFELFQDILNGWLKREDISILKEIKGDLELRSLKTEILWKKYAFHTRARILTPDFDKYKLYAFKVFYEFRRAIKIKEKTYKNK